MESFVRITAIAVPMMRINIDTDQIVPSRELVRVRSEGYAPSLFASSRYIGDRKPNPDFILNVAPWSGARILLTGQNFGCGSSREAAPMALRAWGFRVIIAPSFGGIFYNNCFRNGLLPVELPADDVSEIAALVENSKGAAQVTVDLDAKIVQIEDKVYPFNAPNALRTMLLNGVDEIDATLSLLPNITQFRNDDAIARPWAYSVTRRERE